MERIRKEAVWNARVFLQNHENHSQDSRCPCRDWNRESKVLPLYRSIRWHLLIKWWNIWFSGNTLLHDLISRKYWKKKKKKKKKKKENRNEHSSNKFHEENECLICRTRFLSFVWVEHLKWGNNPMPHESHLLHYTIISYTPFRTPFRFLGRRSNIDSITFSMLHALVLHEVGSVRAFWDLCFFLCIPLLWQKFAYAA
jgi:hypothetical protein